MGMVGSSKRWDLKFFGDREGVLKNTSARLEGEVALKCGNCGNADGCIEFAEQVAVWSTGCCRNVIRGGPQPFDMAAADVHPRLEGGTALRHWAASVSDRRLHDDSAICQRV
jgi:hypothetical protein